MERIRRGFHPASCGMYVGVTLPPGVLSLNVLEVCYTTVRQSTMRVGSDTKGILSTAAAITVLGVSGSRREDGT